MHGSHGVAFLCVADASSFPDMANKGIVKRQVHAWRRGLKYVAWLHGDQQRHADDGGDACRFLVGWSRDKHERRSGAAQI
jgi:hypothetical protein